MAGQGRHSEYTPEMGDRICNIVATHTMGLKVLCKIYPELPDDSTVYEWRLKHDDFSRNYVKAKQLQAELMAEEIIYISDDCSDDIRYDKDGNEHCNTEFVARSRLRVDSRKWIASKLAPKIYGDKQQVELVTTENDELKKELADLRAKLLEQSKSEY